MFVCEHVHMYNVCIYTYINYYESIFWDSLLYMFAIEVNYYSLHIKVIQHNFDKMGKL